MTDGRRPRHKNGPYWDRPEMDMDRDDQIASLFARWKAAASGVAMVSLEELCRDCPDLLDDFRARLPLLEAVDALFAPESKELDSEEISLDAEGFSSLTFHRQGGLGIVLIGEEAGLNRPVAVKKLKPTSARDPSARQRFIAEAEITARLEHPGVVPIYRAGHDSQGQPFYAMRFVEGETLGDAISRFYGHANPESSDQHLEFRRLIRSIAAVCQTVAYAHSRGVIHRDLKPDNVMLGPFGEVLVLDWGLAKKLHDHDMATDRQAESSEFSAPDPLPEHSIEGRAKGAPGFMSPEQASGNWPAVTEATDIYGLGATLYVALTGRSPYSGRDAQEVISKVIEAPPVSPLQLSPSADRALTAICRKAMARVRDERYGSALDLANDLERWLADESVSVYRDPPLVRMQRWMRRHRPVVAGGAAAMAVLVVALAVLAIQQRRSAQRERAAKEQLSATYTRLRQASVGFLSHSMGEQSSPQMHAALADVRRHFEELSDGDAADRFELAAIDNTEGGLYLRSKDAARAVACFARAETHLTKALKQEPEQSDIKEALATTWLNLGSAALLQEEPGAALDWFEKGLRAVTELKAAGNEPARHRLLEQKLQQAAGRACWTIGNSRWVAGDRSHAQGFFERAQALLAPLAKLEPAPPGVREDYRLNLMSWGKFLQNRGIEAFQQARFEASVREFEQALVVWESLSVLDPTDVGTLQHLRHVCAGLASACQQRAQELSDSQADQSEQLKQVLTTGLAAIERLPAFSPEIKELKPVRAELEQRLKALEDHR